MKLAVRFATVLATIAAGTAMAAITPHHSENLTFNGYPVSLNDGAVMVGKSSYTGTTSGSFLAWCIVRDADQVGEGQNYDVNVFLLNDPDLVDLLGITLTDLKAMAWLGSGFNNTNPDTSYRHHAIWEVTNPATYTLNAAEQALYDAAYLNAGSVNGAAYFVALPTLWGTAQSVGQPIMWPNPIPGDDTTIPEPSSVALLISGLAGGIVIHRRRRAEQQ
jgi:hypothetical protein